MFASVLDHLIGLAGSGLLWFIAYRAVAKWVTSGDSDSAAPGSSDT